MTTYLFEISFAILFEKSQYTVFLLHTFLCVSDLFQGHRHLHVVTLLPLLLEPRCWKRGISHHEE